MKKSLWGPAIWKTLHVLTIKLKDEYFESQKKIIIDFILGVCQNLPCPYCSQHACDFLKRHKINYIKSKEQLIKLIFMLHNDANKRLKKPLFDEEQLYQTYEKFNYEYTMKMYFKVVQQANYNEKMMLYSIGRKQFIKKYIHYIKNNLDKFD